MLLENSLLAGHWYKTAPARIHPAPSPTYPLRIVDLNRRSRKHTDSLRVSTRLTRTLYYVMV